MLNNITKFLFLSSIVISIFFAHISFATILASKELLEILNDLKIASDCDIIKYSRNDWKHWIKKEKKGYNTRQMVLITESLIAPSLKLGSKKVIKGRWYDPYTDQIFNDPSNLDIDHFVPLNEAHKSGGCYWSKAKKKRYANYLKNSEELIAVSKKANRSKGQKDPAQWLPENEDYKCEYISNWLIIKDRWGLWIDKEEKEAITKIIHDYCINQETEFAIIDLS